MKTTTIAAHFRQPRPGTERVTSNQIAWRSVAAVFVVAHFLAPVAAGAERTTAGARESIAAQKTENTVPTPVLASTESPAFIAIQPGTFIMGSKEGEKDDRPTHQVTLSRTFELQATEVTQAQWTAVMKTNPSYFRGENRPVESVSWHDVQAFIARMNARRDGYRYRLPTEAEWEFACRAGTPAEMPGNLDEVCLYDRNSALTSHPVRSKRPNAWGLFDMQGNVWEWVQDYYTQYSRRAVVDPQGPEKGEYRMMRGGGWHSTADGCRMTFRLHSEPTFRNSALGFRLVRTLVTQSQAR